VRASVFSSVLVIAALGVACGPDFETSGSEQSFGELRAGELAPAIIDATQLAAYRAALPVVAYKRLQDIFDDPTTFWYDKATMIPSYQDSVGDGSYTPIGARPNSRAHNIIVPEGRRLFTADGEHWSFPFGVTAGTENVPNRHVLNFLSLPKDSGDVLPVVYETSDDNRALGGLGLHKWTWMFPKGTTVGEIMFLEEAGDLYPVEVRIRTRYLSAWATNVYRPFPTAERLAETVRASRPGWASQADLQALVTHLEDSTTIEPKTIPSPAFDDLVVLDGYIDEIPTISDSALVRELLTTTPFVSAYGLSWKARGLEVAFAASTTSTFNVVPANYDAGLIEVREQSCVRCHRDAGRAINDFEPRAILYGDIWGEDRIFSFHPWDQDRFRIFNNENRQVRPALASGGIVVRYDAARHGGAHYAWIDPPR